MRDAPPCFLSNAVPGRTADGVRAGGENTHTAVISYRATRARSSNPAGPPVAALPAAWPRSSRRAVKVADREDRGAIFRTKIGDFPHQPRPRASKARCFCCARVTQQDITSGIGPERGTDQGRSS